MTYHIVPALLAGLLAGVAAGAGEPEYRTFDGSGNNVDNPLWGTPDFHLMRMADEAYPDNASMPARMSMPSTRLISNVVCAQQGVFPNSRGASNFLWQWGQFIDHDLDLTDVMVPLEPLDILVPPGDPVFDPMGKGGVVIPFNRSIYDVETGTEAGNPRQQINQITAFIDASNVYGSDDDRAAALRTNDGTGRLKTSEGRLLPFNVDGLPNLGGP
ncbi:MAG: peroxidase family protein, partial [Planctomycetota bacterium]